MKCKILKITSLIIGLVTTFCFIVNAEVIVDKKGRDVIETVTPTEPSTVDENMISDALRIKTKLSGDSFIINEDNEIIVIPNSNPSKKGFENPSKNIFSSNTLYDVNTNIDPSLITIIRHTSSITNVEDGKYELHTDLKSGRLMMNILLGVEGIIQAKNGFYKVNGKTYYFDKDGVMVLGFAEDDIGNTYFFSYETGELIEEIQKK